MSVKCSGPHRVVLRSRDHHHDKRPRSLSPQARGSAGGRRRHDAASQEDHDKPYVCDSKYSRCHLPAPPLLSSPVPMLPWLWHPQPQAPWLLLLGLHPSLHACPLREGTTSFGCRRRHSPTQEASCLWCPAPVSGSACSVAFF